MQFMQGRIYYEANEASASGPHHLGGPHQNFNAVLKADFFIFVKDKNSKMWTFLLLKMDFFNRLA